MTKFERLEGCILGGAIGDAWGSAYENNSKEDDSDVFYPFGKPAPKIPNWQITDDTQLTLATLEAIIEDKSLHPETFARHFLRLYQQKRLTGIGASTLKALRELAVDAHWSQVGRKGEYAAGNGAAMRIAPLAFVADISSYQIREICRITHHNDEAYIGAKAVVLTIKATINGDWDGTNNLIEYLIPQLPDTRVRDRLIAIKDIDDLHQIGALGNSGYVVNSIPLAIAAANKMHQIGFTEMYQQLIDIGGDTDTNCSIAGQIAGALVGKEGIPKDLLLKFSKLKEYEWIERIIKNWKANQ